MQVLKIYCVCVLFLIANTAQAQVKKAPLGINLASVKDWSSEFVFKDAFKQAREWIPQQFDNQVWDTGDILDVDENGWIASLEPGKAAGAVLFAGLNGHYSSGTYVCLYEGSGTFQFRFDATVTNTQPGRILVSVSVTGQGLLMKLVETDPENPVKNIRFVPLEFESSYQTEPFHPQFLENIQPFSVLRFMDWQETNNSEIVEWSERATPEYFSQTTDKGVALEYQISLANTVHEDPWFTIPHKANDNYVREFARMVRDSLDSDLKAYVEYSNEVWNWGFSQANYALAKGVELGLNPNQYEAQTRFYSQRSVEIFNLFEEEFGGTERLVRVLGTQNSSPYKGIVIMDWNEAYKSADVLAGAPYFGGDLGSPATQLEIQELTVSQLLDSMAVDIDETLSLAQENKNEAEARGLAYIAYESGQHLVGVNEARNNQTLTDLFIAANRDPGMKDLYTDYLNKWDAFSDDLMVLYNSTIQFGKYGSWGLLEYQNQPEDEAPKYSAVLEYLSSGTDLDESRDTSIPQTISLFQNYPNPFNPRTTIGYSVERTGPVDLSVYNVLGERVATLVNGLKPVGEHAATFDAAKLSSGIYFYRLTVGDYSETRRMVLLR